MPDGPREETVTTQPAPPWDDDDYPEGHGPYCHRSCDHPCHDRYDKWAAENGRSTEEWADWVSEAVASPEESEPTDGGNGS